MPLSDLTADEFRALHVTADEDTRRAIRRRLNELDNQPHIPQLPSGWWRDPHITRAVLDLCGPAPVDGARVASAVDTVAKQLDRKGKKP